MRLAILLLTIATVFLWPTQNFSQQHNFKSWSVESGLQSQVTCIAQDKRGYMWIGTSNGGVALFDGKNFSFYTKENGLSNNNISAICEDKKGNMWVGTNKGIDVFNGKSFFHINTQDSVFTNDDANVIRDIICDHTGRMWVATEECVKLFDAKPHWFGIKNFENLKLSHRKVYRLFEDSKGNIWFGNKIGKTDGVDMYDGKKITHYKLHLTTGNTQADFAEDKNGKIWIGVRHFGPKAKTVVYTLEKGEVNGFTAPLFDQFNVNDLLITQNGKLFLGTTMGVIKASGLAITSTSEKKLKADMVIYSDSRIMMGKWKANGKDYDTVFMFDVFNKRFGLPNESVNCLFEDKEQNMWLGTEYGIVKYTNDAFVHFGEKDSLKDVVMEILEDNTHKVWARQGPRFFVQAQNGFESLRTLLRRYLKDSEIDVTGVFCSRSREIWMGSSRADVLCYSNENLTRVKKEGILKKCWLSPECEDEKGNIWFRASENEHKVFLACISPNEKPFKLKLFPDSLPGFVQQIIPGANGALWMVIEGKGLCKWQNGKCLPAPGLPPEARHSVYNVVADLNGNLWWRSDEYTGIVFYTGQDIKVFNASNGFTNESSTTFLNDHKKNAWIGSDGEGVFCFDGKKFTQYSTKDGLDNNTIMSLVSDEKGNVWVGTNKGINKIERDDKGNLIRIRHYGYNEGFIGIECNQNAAWKDSDGNLWFGTSSVLTKYNPKEDVSGLMPKINFNGLSLFYEKTDWKEYSDSISSWTNMPAHLVLPYNKNHLTFSFSGVFHRAPESVRYKFMMIGSDSAFSKETGKTDITYSNLSPGKYTFKVMAGTTDGNWNPEPLNFSFEVLYPWWRTWWAYSIYVIAGSAAIFTFIRYRTKKLEAEKQKLQALVQERTHELQQQKELVEEKNKEMLDSIRYASRIQRALITSERYIHKSWNALVKKIK